MMLQKEEMLSLEKEVRIYFMRSSIFVQTAPGFQRPLE